MNSNVVSPRRATSCSSDPLRRADLDCGPCRRCWSPRAGAAWRRMRRRVRRAWRRPCAVRWLAQARRARRWLLAWRHWRGGGYAVRADGAVYEIRSGKIVSAAKMQSTLQKTQDERGAHRVDHSRLTTAAQLHVNNLTASFTAFWSSTPNPKTLLTDAEFGNAVRTVTGDNSLREYTQVLGSVCKACRQPAGVAHDHKCPQASGADRIAMHNAVLEATHQYTIGSGEAAVGVVERSVSAPRMSTRTPHGNSRVDFDGVRPVRGVPRREHMDVLVMDLTVHHTTTSTVVQGAALRHAEQVRVRQRGGAAALAGATSFVPFVVARTGVIGPAAMAWLKEHRGQRSAREYRWWLAVIVATVYRGAYRELAGYLGRVSRLTHHPVAAVGELVDSVL